MDSIYRVLLFHQECLLQVNLVYRQVAAAERRGSSMPTGRISRSAEGRKMYEKGRGWRRLEVEQVAIRGREDDRL